MEARKIINKQLGQLLIEKGSLTQEQLNKALALQKEKGGLIGELLVELGFVTEEDIAQALTALYGFPFLPLANYEINIKVIKVIPARVARLYCLIPVDKFANNLTITMANPLNIQAIEDVEMLSGCNVQAFVSTASEIEKAIEKYYKGE